MDGWEQGPEAGGGDVRQQAFHLMLWASDKGLHCWHDSRQECPGQCTWEVATLGSSPENTDLCIPAPVSRHPPPLSCPPLGSDIDSLENQLAFVELEG
jgi:hypothetical protein